MKCTACKSENADEARFCAHCGLPLMAPAAPVPLVCQSCGAAHTADAVFCAACGHRHHRLQPGKASARWAWWVGVGVVVLIVLLGYVVFGGGKKATLIERTETGIPPDAVRKPGQKSKSRSTDSASSSTASTPNNPNFVRELEACKTKGFLERGICSEQVQWKYCSVNGVWDTTKPGCER